MDSVSHGMIDVYFTQIQDQYTEEALKADDREAALKLQLSHLEDRLRTAEMKLQ